ncbi:MAG: hypothetical protein AAGI15_10675 [Pseudomonadota bacterium]
MSANPEPAIESDDPEATADSQADAKVIVIIFAAAVLFAVHFASGWSFDF